MTKYNYYPILVIGAGAAGCMAAISAAREFDNGIKNGAVRVGATNGRHRNMHRPCDGRVLVLEKNARIADKIYATGNGRCNIANAFMSEDCYYTDSARQPLSLLDPFGRDDLRSLFEDAGVFWHDRGGYFYPRTDQAATVSRFFERAFRRCNIDCVLNATVTSISRPDKNGLIEVNAGPYVYQTSAVVCAPGSCSGLQGRKNDSKRNSSPYSLVLPYHTVKAPVPALVPLLTDDPLIRTAAGVRCSAVITICVEGNIIRQESGELQITEHGISGIPVFQLSRIAARALQDGAQEVICHIDFLPEFTREAWEKELHRRLSGIRDDDTLLDLFDGLVSARVASYVIRSCGFADEKKLSNLEPDIQKKLPESMLRSLRDREIRIIGTAGFEKSQVTAGGVDLTQIDEHMMSRVLPGLFLAGEVLDADGICGGYNLTLAMCTGHTAGLYAARYAAQAAES